MLPKTLHAKKEAVYGTDAAPTGANAIITRNFRATPLEVDRVQRNLDRPNYGAAPSAPSNARTSFSYEVEIAGSGAAGTAPPWMTLLEACGMAPAIVTAGVKAEQSMALASAAQGSLTQYHWMGTQRRKALGTRGTFTADFTVGQVPFFGFQFQGLLPAVPFDEVAPGAPDWSKFQEPIEFSHENSDFTLDAYAVLLKSLRIDAGVDVKQRHLVGARYISRGNHAIRVRATVEAPSIAAKDYLATLKSGAMVPFTLVHGLTAGAIVEVSAPKLQLQSISESEEDDKLMWDLDMISVATNGGDDLLFAAK